MSNEDGTVWVTFNGEIYNFKELRLELEKHGHRFATNSDTEVIVHAYEQFGANCVQHFRGMFAFAIWDSKQRIVLLARDRVGKKPLFYALVDGQLVFASELQALVQYPGIKRTPSVAAIDEYLTYGYIPARERRMKSLQATSGSLLDVPNWPCRRDAARFQDRAAPLAVGVYPQTKYHRRRCGRAFAQQGAHRKSDKTSHDSRMCRLARY